MFALQLFIFFNKCFNHFHTIYVCKMCYINKPALACLQNAKQTQFIQTQQIRHSKQTNPLINKQAHWTRIHIAGSNKQHSVAALKTWPFWKAEGMSLQETLATAITAKQPGLYHAAIDADRRTTCAAWTGWIHQGEWKEEAGVGRGGTPQAVWGREKGAAVLSVYMTLAQPLQHKHPRWTAQNSHTNTHTVLAAVRLPVFLRLFWHVHCLAAGKSLSHTGKRKTKVSGSQASAEVTNKMTSTNL